MNIYSQPSVYEGHISAIGTITEKQSLKMLSPTDFFCNVDEEIINATLRNKRCPNSCANVHATRLNYNVPDSRHFGSLTLLAWFLFTIIFPPCVSTCESSQLLNSSRFQNLVGGREDVGLAYLSHTFLKKKQPKTPRFFHNLGFWKRKKNPLVMINKAISPYKIPRPRAWSKWYGI